MMVRFFNQSMKQLIRPYSNQAFNMRWLTKPGEPQRVLFSFENKDYEKCIKFQENLTKEGIPSLVSHKDSGDFQLEVWNNNKVFIKKLDSIAAKTNEEINCISSEIQSYSNRA